MAVQAQGIDRYVSEIKLELFRQIDRLSYAELVALAGQFDLDVEEKEIELTPEELAEVVSFESIVPVFVSTESLELEIEIDESEEEEVELTPEELAEVVSFEPYDGPATFQGDLDEGYAEKYADEESEREAHAWVEGTINFDEINQL